MVSADTETYQVLQDYIVGREHFSSRVGRSSGEGFAEKWHLN